MSDQVRQDLLEQVKSTKNRLAKSSVEDIEALDVEYRLDGQLNLKDIIITVATGGPRIDISLGKYRIDGYWTPETVDYPIFESESKVRSTIDSLWYYYKEMFESQL